MGVLNLLLALFGRRGLGGIIFAVMLHDVVPGHPLRLLGYPGRVGTQIGDQAHRPLSLQFHTLIKLLGQTHGFLGGEVQHLAGLLLQRGGGKRQRGLLDPLSFFHFLNLPGSPLQVLQQGVHLLLAVNLRLMAALAVIFGGQGLFLPSRFQAGFQSPVLLGDKSANLRLPVTDDTQCHGLHPARTEAPFHLCPQKRGNPIPHHPIQRPAGLLGVHQIHVDLSGVFQGFLHGTLGDLIEGNAVDFLIRHLLQLQGVHQMPGDGLPLPVRVGGQIDLVGLFHFLAQARQHIPLPPDGDILWLEVVFHIDSQAALGQIPHMAAAGRHLVIAPQYFFYCLHLGRRLQNHQIFCHCLIPCFPVVCSVPKPNRETLYTNLGSGASGKFINSPAPRRRKACASPPGGKGSPNPLWDRRACRIS